MITRLPLRQLSSVLALCAGSAALLPAQNTNGNDVRRPVRVSNTREARSATAVADAAMRGDLAAVRSLLATRADVNTPLGDGMTALHWAAERGDVAMTAALLKAGAKPTAVTVNGGYSPLHVAARNGAADVVKALLAAGADAKATTASGATALHMAAEAGNAAAIKALVAKKADVNARESQWGQTPLMFAAASDRPEAVKALALAGADPSLRTRMVNLSEELARQQSAAKKRNEVLWGFLPEATRDSIKKATEKAAAEALRNGGGRGAPPAAMAMAMAGRGRGGAPGDSGAARPARPDSAPAFRVPNLPDKFFTPTQIDEAVKAGRTMYGATSVGAATQEIPADTTNGFQFGLEATVGSMGGLTALHHAVRQGNIPAALALLDAGADINAPMLADSTTPLLMAAVNGQYDMAVALVKKGADVKRTSVAGLTPLYAVLNTYWHPKSRYPQPQAWQVQKTSYLEVMDAMLKAGADVNAVLKKNLWFFGYSNCGNANCGLELLDGTTAFWRAAYAVDLDAMKLLKAAGAIDTIPSRPPARRARPGAGAPGGPDQFALAPTANQVPVGVGTYPIHSAAGVGYGNGFAGNAHRHAPDGWMPVMKYLVEELHHDVNKRDAGGFTPLHHAAARGDNEMILYLVSKGADPKAVARNGQTTVDLANGPVQRLRPFPETIQLLEKLGAKNNHKCVGC